MNRITVNPAQCGGMACIRGLRIPVVSILKMMASGMSPEEILREYPDLVLEDIQACLEYAAWLASEKISPIAMAG
jgi:uncharacterized protein (DUF433 family)